MSTLKRRRDSRRPRPGGIPLWCFLAGWFGGLFAFAAGMATVEWGLGKTTGGAAIITGALAVLLFIMIGVEAERSKKP